MAKSVFVLDDQNIIVNVIIVNEEDMKDNYIDQLIGPDVGWKYVSGNIFINLEGETIDVTDLNVPLEVEEEIQEDTDLEKELEDIINNL